MYIFVPLLLSSAIFLSCLPTIIFFFKCLMLEWTPWNMIYSCYDLTNNVTNAGPVAVGFAFLPIWHLHNRLKKKDKVHFFWLWKFDTTTCFNKEKNKNEFASKIILVIYRFNIIYNHKSFSWWKNAFCQCILKNIFFLLNLGNLWWGPIPKWYTGSEICQRIAGYVYLCQDQ